MERTASRGGDWCFWRRDQDGASGAYVDVKTLHAKIGELTLENDLYDGLRVNIHFKAPVDFIQSRQIGVLFDVGRVIVRFAHQLISGSSITANHNPAYTAWHQFGGFILFAGA